MAEEELNQSLEYTPTWIVAVVCSIIVFISLIAERALHRLGKYLKRKKQKALYRALNKLEEELMLLGFISLLLTVFQDLISHICISPKHATQMLPCKRSHESLQGSGHDLIDYDTIINRRRLFSTDTGPEHCRREGKVPLLSLEGLHQLHIFIFVLAIVHVVFCATTMILGGARIRQWKSWEDHARRKSGETLRLEIDQFFNKHAQGYWRKAAVVGWLRSFFKQFYGSVAKYDYLALRQGFIKEHYPNHPDFNFHNYITRTLEVDFRKVIGISLKQILLLVGAKLEHIITRLGQESVAKEDPTKRVKPSDEYFWFGRPAIVLDLLHFTLFQNSFEIAFFFWIWHNCSSALQLQHLASLHSCYSG
ncbi:hypothetical protein TSUD_378990 [Trifolium subterraneum]|uniref:MLO-like protein n=1 Tax=Trifolium subterraneum TaxID=3900 RepID=A0A2Z6NKZ4_TRISU|nr:hypothetical protein TSUD_378990 [Trifolium subterraneum]